MPSAHSASAASGRYSWRGTSSGSGVQTIVSSPTTTWKVRAPGVSTAYGEWPRGGRAAPLPPSTPPPPVPLSVPFESGGARRAWIRWDRWKRMAATMACTTEIDTCASQ